jgi:hypothetical protein
MTCSYPVLRQPRLGLTDLALTAPHCPHCEADNVMSDSDFGAVTRYVNNLDIIDNDWMQDEISEAEVG